MRAVMLTSEPSWASLSCQCALSSENTATRTWRDLSSDRSRPTVRTNTSQANAGVTLAAALASVSSMADYEHDERLQPLQAELAPGLRTTKCGFSPRSA